MPNSSSSCSSTSHQMTRDASREYDTWCRGRGNNRKKDGVTNDEKL